MNKISLRPWSLNDLDQLISLANNAKIASNLTNAFPHPYTEEAGKNFISMSLSGDPIHIMAIDIDGIAIGAIGVHQQADIFSRNAELGYWIGEPYWGNGWVTKAISLMTDYAFHKFDIDRIFARPFGSNIASQKALEKNNYILEARLSNTIYKQGVYHDELIYAKRK